LLDARELNRPLDSRSIVEKVLDSPAKSMNFSDFPEDQGGPKTAAKDPDNLEKPDRGRSAKRKPRNE
jgi:hypothetical protein